MKLNAILLAGIIFIGTFVSTKADILDRWSTNLILSNSYAMDSIAYGNGIYVATSEYVTGDPGEIYCSVDGTHWTQVYFNSGIWGINLHYVDGCFVGTTGGYGQVAISLDGTNWSISQVPSPESFDRGDATCNDELFVAVGNQNEVGAVYYSYDATNWTAGNISPSAGGAITSVASVVYDVSNDSLAQSGFPFPPPPTSPVNFVALGNNDGNEYTSSDGISWTRRSIPGGSQVSYGYGLFIVPLNAQNNLVSVDGINWSQHLTGLTSQLGWIICSHGLFIGQSGGHLATSIDGINWVQYAPPLPGLVDQYETLATDGNRIVTIGSLLTASTEYNDFYEDYAYVSDLLVSVRMTNSPAAQVALSGLVGRSYQIQSANSLTAGSNNWSTNLSIQLTTTPYVWTDSTATNSARFYRGVLQP